MLSGVIKRVGENLKKSKIATKKESLKIKTLKMGWLRNFAWALTRRKPMDMDAQGPTDLKRCLNTLDLTAMGVGATLGFGLYVLSGEVAAMKAGPAVVLSFMIAAIASTFSALCYAEFAAKVPKSGSAYAYSYITVSFFGNSKSA